LAGSRGRAKDPPARGVRGKPCRPARAERRHNGRGRRRDETSPQASG
jgi:hypothetical protein